MRPERIIEAVKGVAQEERLDKPAGKGKIKRRDGNLGFRPIALLPAPIESAADRCGS
jgi:hypothetical protein